MEAQIESWQINQRVNLDLLKKTENEWLEMRSFPRGRTILMTWIHIHHVRLSWLGAANLDCEPGLEKIRRTESNNTDSLVRHLNRSSEVMEQMLRKVFEKGKISGFKRSPAVFLAYILAHEAHHRGQITLCLRLNGHGLKSPQIYELWEWDKL